MNNQLATIWTNYDFSKTEALIFKGAFNWIITITCKKPTHRILKVWKLRKFTLTFLLTKMPWKGTKLPKRWLDEIFFQWEWISRFSTLCILLLNSILRIYFFSFSYHQLFCVCRPIWGFRFINGRSWGRWRWHCDLSLSHLEKRKERI